MLCLFLLPHSSYSPPGALFFYFRNLKVWNTAWEKRGMDSWNWTLKHGCAGWAFSSTGEVKLSGAVGEHCVIRFIQLETNISPGICFQMNCVWGKAQGWSLPRAQSLGIGSVPSDLEEYEEALENERITSNCPKCNKKRINLVLQQVATLEHSRSVTQRYSLYQYLSSTQFICIITGCVW